MPGINQVTVADAYGGATPKAEVLDVFTGNGGWFSVAVQPVVVQLQWGARGSSRFTDEQVLGVGAFGTIPPGATGIRFRNLTPGSAATVTAYVATGGKPADPKSNVWPEPALAISAIGSVTVAGKAPTQTVITAAGAGNYSTPVGCVAIRVECIGGGGGSGGVAGAAAPAQAVTGGGGSGAYSSVVIPSPAATYAYVVGAGGTAGQGAGPTAGGAGTDTSFGAGPLCLAKAGAGSPAQSGTTVPFSSNGAAGGSASTGVGTVKADGGAGAAGFAVNSVLAVEPGNGGQAPSYGGAALGPRTGGQAGVPGAQFGGGASGAGVSGVGNFNGAAGAIGVIVVTEFY